MSAAFNAMLERLEQERQRSSSRSLGQQEEERRRLASELHDQVGQGITALLLQLKTVMDQAPIQLQPELVEVQAIARENLDEVRRIARRLRPTVLDDLGLAYALLALTDAADPGRNRTSGRRTTRLPLQVKRDAYGNMEYIPCTGFPHGTFTESTCDSCHGTGKA